MRWHPSHDIPGGKPLVCSWNCFRISGCVCGRSQPLLYPVPALPSFSPSKVTRAPQDTGPDASRFPHHQGNIEFVELEEGGQEQGRLAVTEEVLVDHVAELTATPREMVLRCLLARTVASGGRDLIEKGHTAAEASYARDACAKVLWGWVVMAGNPRGLPGGDKARGSQKQLAPGLCPGSVPATL